MLVYVGPSNETGDDPSQLAHFLFKGMVADRSSTARDFLTRPPNGTPRRAISPCEGLSSPSPHCHTFSPKGVAGLSFTARIRRASFHRARSASKKDGLVAPFTSFGGHALREHRRSSGSIPPLFREQEDGQATPPIFQHPD
jgi:hypothetical protein